ncbi:hypothetical protein FSARC_14112 [Fusarium sarcochroum]|uniref:Glutathione S-transferase n=1 Tax=Fusarium sarcochroum TaxID=1208366 RepID=A0A8H4WQR4_9HYPO|nr:hypothetical protein FSARC_14112 [Fusarium sarcochroum]
MTEDAKIIFYTVRQCPYAHRVYITLAELGIPYEEKHIDISVPRSEEYLKINPRGKIPSLNYNGKILIESDIIARFLADAHPSHLIPPSASEAGALRRACVQFFFDTYINRVQALVYQAIDAKTDSEADKIGEKLVENVVKEIEPALSDASPYFAGSDKVTLVEALVASHVIRLRSLGRRGIVLSSAVDDLTSRAPNFTKWGNTLESTPSIIGIFDEGIWISRIGEKVKAARLGDGQ